MPQGPHGTRKGGACQEGPRNSAKRQDGQFPRKRSKSSTSSSPLPQTNVMLSYLSTNMLLVLVFTSKFFLRWIQDQLELDRSINPYCTFIASFPASVSCPTDLSAVLERGRPQRHSRLRVNQLHDCPIDLESLKTDNGMAWVLCECTWARSCGKIDLHFILSRLPRVPSRPPKLPCNPPSGPSAMSCLSTKTVASASSSCPATSPPCPKD
jgi:hypothetical protein